MKTLLVTGCAGFIGSNFVHTFLANGRDAKVINLDKLTYAGNLANLAALQNDPRHVFVQGDIGDRALVERLLQEHQPDAVVNFAAESHVDRSVRDAGPFIDTNVRGTQVLLDAAVRAKLPGFGETLFEGAGRGGAPIGALSLWIEPSALSSSSTEKPPWVKRPAICGQGLDLLAAP